MKDKMCRFYVLLCYTFLALLFYAGKIDAKCSSESAGQTCRHGSEICPACIDVSWLVRPPYTFQGINTTEGILPGNFF